jgi:hypothetical protein
MFGVAFDYLYNYRIPERIMEALDSKKGLLADRVATTYLTNHDRSHLAWQAGASSIEQRLCRRSKLTLHLPIE